ncbi:MAG: hypothetical protein GY870_10550 [archaeon]|nr:hypothetical protein [archaeon]
MKRNYFYSLEMLKNNSVLFTVPYDSMISNGARKANTIFAGINGIYKLLDQNTFINQRVIFSVYYGVNDIRYHSRVPCFIPEPLKEFYFNQVEFIGTKYRRQYSFRSLRNIAFANAEDPKHLLDIDWSMYSYFTHGEKIQHLKDVSYIIDEDQKVIKILDVKQPGNGLNILLKKKKEGYVLDARINLASKEAPWITNLLSKFNFQIANYTISSITLDPDTNQVMTIKKAREPFPDGINTSDFLEMTTQAHRHCKLVGNSDESQNDPNVVKFLQQYPQDNVIQDYRNRFIVKEKQEVLSKL